MSYDRDIVRGYSQDRRFYRHESVPIEIKTSSIKMNSSQRNSSEMLYLFSLSIKRLDKLEQTTNRTIVNYQHDLDMINNSIQSLPSTPISNHPQQSILPNSNATKK